MMQDKIFKQSEGDNWFKRNKKALIKKRLRNDLVLKVIKLFNIKPKKTLELGCANGYRLNYIKNKYNSKCYGLDCSNKAIVCGKNRYKNLSLYCGGVEKLNFEDSFFDLIIIHFVFHWVDRKLLKKAISEADRVLKDKGVIIIGDFYPLYPVKKAYHHIKDKKVYTYKDDYPGMFEDIGYYQNIGRITGECGSRHICIDVSYDNRFKIDLLKKDLCMKKKNDR